MNWWDFTTNRESAIGLRGVLYSAPTRLEGAAKSDGASGISIVSNDVINAFPHRIQKNAAGSDTGSGAPVAGTLPDFSFARYTSLWPHGTVEPKFAAFDGDSQSIALALGNEIVIFGRTDAAKLLEPSTKLSMYFWSVARIGNKARRVGKRRSPQQSQQ